MATEKRLIDANALKANFVDLGEFAKDLWYAGAIRIAIDNAPTVDAVEVVRCEDCRRWKRTGDCRHGICCLDGMELFKWNYEFCNRGERKDNG